MVEKVINEGVERRKRYYDRVRCKKSEIKRREVKIVVRKRVE